MKECNCNCPSLSYNVCPNLCCHDNLCEMDCLIDNLKSELFEKMQKAKDYCLLESKVLQLQKDINLLSEEKRILECKICQNEKEGNQMICELKNKNDLLRNSLNDKTVMNKKLYGENNNLFQALEGKACENQNLKDQMCHQEDIISRLNSDKINLQKTISNLNQLREKNLKDIQNLNTDINILNKNSSDKDVSLRLKHSQNLQLVNEFNSIKCVNTKLFNDLKEKECCLMKKQEELCLLNNNIARLQKELDNLNCLNQRTKEDISCTNNALLSEISIRNNLDKENSKLNCLIADRNTQIKKVNNDNDILKCANTANNNDNIFLNKKVEAYKKHILILTSQNENLSVELENIINRDSQLLHTLGRDTYLRAVQYENKNVINSSLDYLQAFSKNPKKEIDYDKNINININDIKVKDKTYGLNYNDLGNKPMLVNPTQSKSGLKLNMEYSSSFGEDLGQRK